MSEQYDICEELFKSAVRPVGTDEDDYFSVPMDEKLVMKTKKIVFENRKGERKVYVSGRFEEMSEEVLDAVIDSPKFREDLAKAKAPVETNSGPWSRERMEDAFWFIAVAGAALIFAAAVLYYIRNH